MLPIEQLRAEWRETTHNDLAERKRICLAFDASGLSRGDWQKAHKPSYTWAMKHYLVERRIPSQSEIKILSSTTRTGALANARTIIHKRCQVPGGIGIEREAGQALLMAARAELPTETCIRLAFECMEELAAKYYIELRPAR